MTYDILIVDDETDIREIIQGILEDEGYRTRQAANAAQAYEQIGAQTPDLVILDIWLQNSEHDGMQILENIKANHPHIPVVMISGHGNIETAVSAIKQGAYDFIEKPFKSDRLLLLMERALEALRLKRENETLRRRTVSAPVEMVGESALISGLRQTLERVAQTNSRVLITGEAGAGKDVVARVLHRQSRRAAEPFVALNCAIMHPERLESELFGIEGESDKAGVLERAHGGTLLLDEVADMPLETQGKIVRVLQEQRFNRVGGQVPVEVDVRIIASTNRDLKQHMDDGHFRQDLYYRLNVVPLDVPPLRDHVQDIPALAAHFIKQFSEQSGLQPCRLSDSTIAVMQAYRWPGNVRQMRNAVEWVMIMHGGSDAPVQPHQLPPELVETTSVRNMAEPSENMMALPLREARELFEKEYLESQIRRFGGNISKTAQFVGMERSALHRKLKQLGVTGFSGRTGDDGDVEDASLRRA